MERGRRIGEGRTAEVFEWGEGRVLKLYRDWCPPRWAREEAEVVRAVHAAGAPVPAIGYVVEVDGRSGIVFERLPARSLGAELAASPWRAGACGTTLARLHHALHEKRVEPGRLPRLREKVTREIIASADLLGADASRALAALAALPDGDAVCHFDLHPENVLGDGDEARIIDWSNGCVGPPAADVARTLLLLRSPYLPDDVPAALRAIAGGVKRWVAAAYTAEYRRRSGLAHAEIDAWLAPVAAARLGEQIPGEREWLLELVRGALGGS